MEQLVKFISDSISDMTYSTSKSAPGSFDHVAPTGMDRRQADSKPDNAWMESQTELPRSDARRSIADEKSDELNSCGLSMDVDTFGNFTSSEMRNVALDALDWNVGKQRCNLTPLVKAQLGFADDCKNLEANAETSQDVVQQSHVSSSKSPSVLANDIIGPLLLEALDGFLFMVDKKNEIQFISENVTQYLKFTKEDLIGNSVFNLIHAEDHEHFTQAYELLMFDSSCKSPCFTCRMLIKHPGKGQPTYDRMQITTTLQSYPFDSKSNQGNQLVACVARRIGVSKPNIPSAEIEQFTTKQDVKGVILDTSGLNPDNFGFSNLIGQNIQNFCHANDKHQLFKHHREVLSSGTNTSGVYRFKLKEDKYVFVQTKSQLFKNPTNPKLDFIMSTHSIVRECSDDNELKGTASSSLVKAIIGQMGDKQKMRYHQPAAEQYGDYPSTPYYSYPQADLMDAESTVKNKLAQQQYWRGGRGYGGFGCTNNYGQTSLPSKPRGRGERLTTRPVGRPRLHPGGSASSRLHSQIITPSEMKQGSCSVGRDGCPPSVYLGHHQRRRRRHHYHLHRSNSVTMGEAETYSPCTPTKHAADPGMTNGSAESISCFNHKSSFGPQQFQLQICIQKDFGQETSTSMDNFPDVPGFPQASGSDDFLPASEQSFLDELLAETSELGNSLLTEEDLCVDFDESLLEEVTKESAANSFTQTKFTFPSSDGLNKSNAALTQQSFSDHLSFDAAAEDAQLPAMTFKQTDYRGSLAEDRTHLADLLMDGKSMEDSIAKDIWSNKCEEKRKERGDSSSNIILKKLLSQDDDDEDDDSRSASDSNGRVLAMLSGTAIGEVFPGGICKQLKKEMENNFGNNSVNWNTGKVVNNASILPNDGTPNLMFGNERSNSLVNSAPNVRTCDGSTKFFQGSNDIRGKIHISLEEATNINSVDGSPIIGICKERQNILLKELLNETGASLSAPSVQSKLLKSLLASDEANFDVLEEKCIAENSVGLLPIVDKSHETVPYKNNSESNIDDFSASLSLDFDCMTDCGPEARSQKDILENEDNLMGGRGTPASLNRSTPMSVTLGGPNSMTLSSSLRNKNLNLDCSLDSLSFDNSKDEVAVDKPLNVPADCGMISIYGQDAKNMFAVSPSGRDIKFFEDPCTSASTCTSNAESFSNPRTLTSDVVPSDPAMFSYPTNCHNRPGTNRCLNLAPGERPFHKNILLAKLLSENVSVQSTVASSSSSLFPTRNTSSIAVVTPMVHLLKQNKNTSFSSLATGNQSDSQNKDFKNLHACRSRDKMEFANKKVKTDDLTGGCDKNHLQAKPSVSLQPFRCYPQHIYSSSSASTFMSSSTSLFTSLSSPSSNSLEIFTPNAQLHYSGGSVEHVDNKISPDGLVGIIPHFNSSGIVTKMTHYDETKDAFVKNDSPLVEKQTSKSLGDDSKALNNKNLCNSFADYRDGPGQGCVKSGDATGRYQNAPNYQLQSACSVTAPYDYFGAENFSTPVKPGLDASSQLSLPPFLKQMNQGPTHKTDTADTLTKNTQSSNVCSTKPFITQAQPPASSSPTVPIPQINEEDPFSASYSPISPALQDENSQQDATIFSSMSTAFHSNIHLEGTNNGIINASNPLDKFSVMGRSISDDKNKSCLSQGVPVQETNLESCMNACRKEDNPNTVNLNSGFPLSNVQVQSGHHQPLNEWSDRSNQLFMRSQNKRDVFAGDVQGANMDCRANERISRKRIHTEAFLDQSPAGQMSSWPFSGHFTKNDPQNFNSMHQHQQNVSYQKQTTHGDQLKETQRHPSMHVDHQGTTHPSFQGEEMLYARMHPQGHQQQMRFNVVQEGFPPPYQMDRGWSQARPMVSVRHKVPYVQGDYLSLPQDRQCYIGPQMNDKMMVVNKHKHYFSSHLHHVQQTNQLFVGRQTPLQSHSNPHHPAYMKHKGGSNIPTEYASCCGPSGCSPGDPSGRLNQCEAVNYPVYLKPRYHPQQNMFQQHIPQCLHPQLFSQHTPQQFQGESFEGFGRRLQHAAPGQHYRHDFLNKHTFPQLQQPHLPSLDMNHPTSFNNPSFPADSRCQSTSSLMDDSLQVHPESGLLSFPPPPSDEVPTQGTGLSFPNRQDSLNFVEGQQMPSMSFNQMLLNSSDSSVEISGERSHTWNDDSNSFQSLSKSDQILQFNPFSNSNLDNSLKSSITTGSNSLTKEYLRKELRNICTARSLQQNKSNNAGVVCGDNARSDGSCPPSGSLGEHQETTVQGNLPDFDCRKFGDGVFDSPTCPEGKWLQPSGDCPDKSSTKDEKKTQESNVSGDLVQEESKLENDDIFKNIGSLSFTDVESGLFWSSLSGSDYRTTSNSDELY